MRRDADALAHRELSAVTTVAAATVATATLVVETGGEGFAEITQEAARFLDAAGAHNGTLLLFIRHTSASLVIQENADPDVPGDLASALTRLAPVGAGWAHASERPDDMPAHVKAMLTGVSLHVPVIAGGLALGRWQGIYLAEHRSQPRRREIVLQFVGSRR